MDRFIEAFPSVSDGDLMLCPDHGVAYQRDMAIRVPYDAAYFDKCAGYEDKDIALKINAGRIALVDKYVGAAATIIDIGIGSGEFIKKRPNTFGIDVNPVAIAWLKKSGRWGGLLQDFAGLTFWDVIEHVERPSEYLTRVPFTGHVFMSLPIFQNLARVRESKHYRPGEHLYYWTERGLIDWMALYGLLPLERQTFEIDAGRDNILSFAFRKNSSTSLNVKTV